MFEPFGPIGDIVIFVVPGFLLRAGYLRSRARTTPELDLYALAGAIAGSVFVLGLLWFWHGREVFEWAQAHTLLQDDHAHTSYQFFAVLFGAPYFVGLVGGWMLNGLFAGLERGRRHTQQGLGLQLFGLLDRSGLIEHPTVWDDAWIRLRAEKRFWVRIRTPTGGEIIGLFASQSRVGTSPAPRQLYLEYVEHEQEDGTFAPTPGGRGMYVSAENIAAVEFAIYDEEGNDAT